jgi:transposase-like protein
MSEERRFSREFKLSALARMEAGANVSALARELGVRRKYLYQWRERFRLGGRSRCAAAAARPRLSSWRWRPGVRKHCRRLRR